MDEQRVNTMLQVLTEQRNSLANQIVYLQTDLILLEQELKALKEQNKKEE